MTLQEKLNWIKHHDNLPIKTTLTDKFKAKLWVRKTLDEKIRQHPEQLDCLGDQISGRDYVIPLLGVWNNANEIDFDLLPESFVLKANHGWQYNIIIHNKETLNVIETRKQLNHWLTIDFSSSCGELQYKNIPRRIIAEELVLDPTNCLFYCMNGTPRYVSIVTYNSSGTYQNIYDMNFELQPFTIQGCLCTENVKPVNFIKLKTIAQWLCGTFKFVRVDLYAVGDKVFFGEMTFSPYAMGISIKPKEYEDIFNNMLNITEQ